LRLRPTSSSTDVDEVTSLPGTLPIGILPSGTLPIGSIPIGILPSGTLPIGILPGRKSDFFYKLHRPTLWDTPGRYTPGRYPFFCFHEIFRFPALLVLFYLAGTSYTTVTRPPETQWLMIDDTGRRQIYYNIPKSSKTVFRVFIAPKAGRTSSNIHLSYHLP
jgi:hypothetical protein